MSPVPEWLISGVIFWLLFFAVSLTLLTLIWALGRFLTRY